MRSLIDSFEGQFKKLNQRSVMIVQGVSIGDLFSRPAQFKDGLEMFSCGEFVLRSAAAVEQTFSGLTSRLWDDPFEWTLPEYMETPERLIAYLGEVREVCSRGFSFFQTDDDLLRVVPAPRDLTPVIDVLLSCHARAAFFQGKAEAALQSNTEFTPHPLDW